MAFQRVPRTAEVRLTQVWDPTGDNVPVLNTVYCQLDSGTWTATSLQTLADDVAGDIATDWASMASNRYHLVSIDCRSLDTEFGVQASTDVNQQGARAGTPNSSMICGLGQLRGAAGGPPRRGRLFLAGGVEADLDFNHWQTAWVAIADTFLDQLSVKLIEGNRNWVIVSRYLNNELRSEAVTNNVDDWSTRTLVSVQRDRRPSAT